MKGDNRTCSIVLPVELWNRVDDLTARRREETGLDVSRSKILAGLVSAGLDVADAADWAAAATPRRRRRPARKARGR